MMHYDIHQARFIELRHDHRLATQGRDYPGALRRAIRRLTSR